MNVFEAVIGTVGIYSAWEREFYDNEQSHADEKAYYSVYVNLDVSKGWKIAVHFERYNFSLLICVITSKCDELLWRVHEEGSNNERAACSWL
jgi:hypothetical protein